MAARHFRESKTPQVPVARPTEAKSGGAATESPKGRKLTLIPSITLIRSVKLADL